MSTAKIEVTQDAKHFEWLILFQRSTLGATRTPDSRFRKPLYGLATLAIRFVPESQDILVLVSPDQLQNNSTSDAVRITYIKG